LILHQSLKKYIPVFKKVLVIRFLLSMTGDVNAMNPFSFLSFDFILTSSEKENIQAHQRIGNKHEKEPGHYN